MNAVLFIAMSLAGSAGDETLPRPILEATRDATVYLEFRLQDRGSRAIGTGFVIDKSFGKALIMTNRHVVRVPDQFQEEADRQRAKKDRVKNGPRVDPPAVQPAIIGEAFYKTGLVSFFPGTPKQKNVTGKVVLAASHADLGLILVDDFPGLPAPIPFSIDDKVQELDPVFFFGFPFGEKLAGEDKIPSVTVHKGRVGRLLFRVDEQLSRVQINGEVNPGNSGGPMVDIKGRLVGVIHAKATEEAQIGFAVAIPQVVRALKASVLGLQIQPVDGGNRRIVSDALVHVDLFSKGRGWKSVKLIYKFVENPKATPPIDLAKDTSRRSIELRPNGDTAEGNMHVPFVSGESRLYCQVIAVSNTGDIHQTQPQLVSLADGAIVAFDEPNPNEKQPGDGKLTARERLARDRENSGDRTGQEKRKREAPRNSPERGRTARDRLNLPGN